MIRLLTIIFALLATLSTASAQFPVYRSTTITPGNAVQGDSGSNAGYLMDIGAPPLTGFGGVVTPNYAIHLPGAFASNHQPSLTIGTTGTQGQASSGNNDFYLECDWKGPLTSPPVCNDLGGLYEQFIPYQWSMNLGQYTSTPLQPSTEIRLSGCSTRTDFMGQSLQFMLGVNSIVAGGTGYLVGDIVPISVMSAPGYTPGVIGQTNQGFVPGQAIVTAVSGGAVTGAQMWIEGGYTALPSPTTAVNMSPPYHTPAIQNVTNNGSGLMRLTLPFTTDFTTGTQITVANVSGVPGANGTWTGTKIDSTHIDLQGSVFSGTFVASGGPTATWEGGGSGLTLSLSFGAHCPPRQGAGGDLVQFVVDDPLGTPYVIAASLGAATDPLGPPTTAFNTSGSIYLRTANPGQHIPANPPGTFSGVPGANQVVLTYISQYFTQSLFGAGNIAQISTVTAGVAATAQTVFLIKQNGNTVGQITFPASGSVGTPVLYGPFLVVSPNDLIQIVAPATPDATLANLSIDLAPQSFALQALAVDRNQNVYYMNCLGYGALHTCLADQSGNITPNNVSATSLKLKNTLAAPIFGDGETLGAMVRDLPSTNLMLQSFYSASSGPCTSPWTLTTASCAGSSRLTPDGTTDAVTLTATANAGKTLQNETITSLPGYSSGYFACSVYFANQSTPQTQVVSIRETLITDISHSTTATLLADLNRGTSTPSTGAVYSITADPSGLWTRLSLYLQNLGYTTLRFEVFPAGGSASGSADIWEPQCEQLPAITTAATSADTPSGATLPFNSAIGVQPGWLVSGTNIPANDTVLSVTTFPSATVTLVTAPTGDVPSSSAISFYRPQPTAAIPTVASTVQRLATGDLFSTPASSSEPCPAGLKKIDGSFNYLCYPSGTWSRVARSSF